MAEEETTATTPEQEPSTEQQYDICPCCGKPTLKRPVKPGQELTDHWMACMISGTPFTHTYPLFKGRVEIMVGMMSPETEGKLSLLTSMLDLAESRLEGNAPVNMAQVKAMLRMCALVHKVRIRASASDWREYLPINVLDMATAALKAPAENLGPVLASVQEMVTSPENISSIQIGRAHV